MLIIFLANSGIAFLLHNGHIILTKIHFLSNSAEFIIFLSHSCKTTWLHFQFTICSMICPTDNTPKNIITALEGGIPFTNLNWRAIQIDEYSSLFSVTLIEFHENTSVTFLFKLTWITIIIYKGTFHFVISSIIFPEHTSTTGGQHLQAIIHAKKRNLYYISIRIVLIASGGIPLRKHYERTGLVYSTLKGYTPHSIIFLANSDITRSKRKWRTVNINEHLQSFISTFIIFPAQTSMTNRCLHRFAFLVNKPLADFASEVIIFHSITSIISIIPANGSRLIYAKTSNLPIILVIFFPETNTAIRQHQRSPILPQVDFQYFIAIFIVFLYVTGITFRLQQGLLIKPKKNSFYLIPAGIILTVIAGIPGPSNTQVIIFIIVTYTNRTGLRVIDRTHNCPAIIYNRETAICTKSLTFGHITMFIISMSGDKRPVPERD